MAIKSVEYGGKSYEISYEILNAKSTESVLFLHGWGADKELMKRAFSSYLQGFEHIYVDMPGFGSSSMHGALCTSDYAQIMRDFIAMLPQSPTIIVGHSFGGKVATLLNPPTLVLLSSAGIVAPKRLAVRVKIAIFKFFRALGLGRFYKLFATKDAAGMSRTMYETLKNVVDEDFTAKFSAYEGRALVFWGKSDSATPLKSGETIHGLIKNSNFFPLEGDHFFFLKHGNFIAQKITSSLQDA